MVHNVAQPDLELMIETMMENETSVDYRKGWTWIQHEEVRTTAATAAAGLIEETYLNVVS